MNIITLDSTAYYSFQEEDLHVIKAVRKSRITYMSIFAMGEIYTDGRKVGDEQLARILLDRFLLNTSAEVINGVMENAEIFGRLKGDLDKAGTVIPETDIWIAAHAVMMDAHLVTYNKNFLEIPEVKLWDHIR